MMSKNDFFDLDGTLLDHKGVEYLRVMEFYKDNKDFVKITSEESGVSKSNVSIFNIACKSVNRMPNECYYIEDDLYIDIFPFIKVCNCV